MNKHAPRPNPQALMESFVLTTAIALLFIGLLGTPTPAAGETKPFSSMAIASDEAGECRVPKPPANLAETAYLRNGYSAILRILVAEESIASETCDCLLDQFTWEMALEQLPRFQTSDNPRMPFKVLDLYALADALEAEKTEVCAK